MKNVRLLNEVIDFAKKQLARCLVTLDISERFKAAFKRKMSLLSFTFLRGNGHKVEANLHLHILFCFRKIYNLIFIAN